VSVLFADLVGFTTRSETADPESVREFLSAYFQRASEAIARYGGTVEKFIGDAVMAVWGAPTAHEDDAERAVRAALELIGLVHEMDDTVEVRAAVTTGEAAVSLGAVGQGLVAGDLVNTSSRLQSIARPGTVLVDETTRLAAGRAVAFEREGEHQLKGRSEPVVAWRAMRVVAERGGSGRREELEPPFVGRDEELHALKEALHATSREGKPRLVTLVGQPGMGKSRLVWELRKYTDGLMETIWWHEGRSPAYGEGAAYWALGEMVRQRFRIVPADDDHTMRAKLAEGTREHIPDETEREWVEPRIAALLGLAAAPPGDQQELFAAWRALFERIADQGTVVLIFEDLHWGDESLLDFIEHLLEWARSSPILVVAVARPELLDRRSTWGSSQRSSTILHLEPIGTAAMTDLLVGLVPGTPADSVESIADRSEGVPLYAVETIRMLIDGGHLVRDGERYRLADSRAAEAVPATLFALVTARLDGLPADERALVQDASVLGKSFSLEALVAVSSRDRPDVERLIRDLVRKELVAVDTGRFSAGLGQLEFVHGLVREVAYATLARRDRQQRHLAAARYVESLDDDELAGLVASHYLDAWRSAPEGTAGAVAEAQARVALRAAAERSVSLHANAAALTFIEQALTVTDDPGERASLQVLAYEPASASGALDLAERYLREAIAFYGLGGQSAEGRVAIATLASALVQQARIDEVRALIEPLVGELDDRAGPSAPRLLNALARAYLWVNDVDRALEPLDRAIAIAERLDLEPDIAELFATKAWGVDLAGRHRESLLLAEGSLKIAERHGLVATELRARLNLSNGLTGVDPRQAFEVAGRGVELARRIGHATWAASLAGNQGSAAILLGEWDLPLANAVELDRPEGLTDFARGGLLAPASIVEAYRGDPDSARARLAFEVTAAGALGQGVGIALAFEAAHAYAAGRMADVARPALAASDDVIQPSEPVLAACLAAHAAAWLRDRALLETVLARVGSMSWTGELAVNTARQTRAALAALDGRLDEAEEGYRAAIVTWVAMGLRPDVATAKAHMIALLGRRLADRDALEADARRIFAELGAVTLLGWLDRVAVGQEEELEVAR
jgi:class 3 adenylate cyclase